MNTILILLGLFPYFIAGGYISQRYKSMTDLGMVVLWPVYLAGLIGRAIRAKEAQLMARKLKRR